LLLLPSLFSDWTDSTEILASARDASGSYLKDTSKDFVSKAQQTIKAQAQEIKDLQEQIRRLTEEKALDIAQQPTTVVGTTVVDKITYQVLGTGPNAGKLLKKDWTKVVELGKVYKEWVILSEIQLNLGNQDKMVEAQNLSGLDFYRIPDGEHEGRLIQAVTGQSVLEAPEGKFIQWRLREEIKGKHQLLL
jgi:vacuolar-type H+-ATPase subunit H